jgi:5-methylcytosine-specific restriction protein A
VAAVILGWNPNRWNPWDYRAAVEQVVESGRFLVRWNVGRRRNIVSGTEAWLHLQGATDAGSGMIGHGMVASEPCGAGASMESEAPPRYVSVAFDSLLPLGEQLRTEDLERAVPGIRWAGAGRRAVRSVPAAAEPGLRQLWRDLGPAAVDPADLVPGTYPLNAVTRIEVSRYERDHNARRVCLAFHGTSCTVCGFSFEASYGEIGQGFIQVHHVVPDSMLGPGYLLDPITDLVPLCANCHAMAHLGVNTPRTVSELRNIMAASGHLRGDIVSEQALQAQADARRILEGRGD